MSKLLQLTHGPTRVRPPASNGYDQEAKGD